jgi:hypothetical protein
LANAKLDGSRHFSRPVSHGCFAGILPWKNWQGKRV